MVGHASILRAGATAVILLAMTWATPAADHSIIHLLDQSIMAHHEDFSAEPVVPGARGLESMTPETKSAPKAFLLSLLVPGAGQFYAEAPGRGRFFVGTELAIWTGFLGFRLYSDWKEEDYRLYAAEHAGVDPRGKSQGYFEDVSLFMSMEEYNRQQLTNFREEAQLYSQGDFWEWDSEQSRRKFDSLYRASSNAQDNAIIMTGVGVLNHLISAVDAIRSVKVYNRKHASRSSPVQFTIKLRPNPGSSTVMVGLKKKF
jgi:hypothetical protein